jgi:hypothetical protein
MTDFSCESWDTHLKKESGNSKLRRHIDTIILSFWFCVAPLDREAKGKEDYVGSRCH